MVHIYTNFAQAQQQLANIEAIDYFFAKEMNTVLTNNKQISEVDLAVLTHLFIAISLYLRAGHTCLPLVEIADTHWGVGFDDLGQFSHLGYKFPNIDKLILLISEFELNAEALQPIVYDNKKLYMRRYYEFEQQLSKAINTRLNQQAAYSIEQVSGIIHQLFPLQSNQSNDEQETLTKNKEIDWQKIAVANAINKNFNVIAGGPGTGKTYTVTKLLAALLMLHKGLTNRNNQPSTDKKTLEISLVAPTGKAAQRLSESIVKAITGFKGLIDDEILSIIPKQAKTIHRLLGVIPNSPNFRHHQNNLLSCDVLLIDEVSMVDLPMMTRIFRALKPQAKIILLGDADQLPSVAVGSVLADIAPRPHHGYSVNNLNYLSQVCHIPKEQLHQSFESTDLLTTKHHDYLSFLHKSRRFDGEGGIGKLASHVINGEIDQSWQLLLTSTGTQRLSKSAVQNQLTLVDNSLSAWLSPLVSQYYQGIAECENVDDAFTLLNKFRVLCVTRQGELGVDAINQTIKEQLFKAHKSDSTSFHGMPIMINENDYRLGLFNGDIGLLWRSNEGHLLAYFETSELNSPQQDLQQMNNNRNKTFYKTLIPSRLPKYDAVYAMTIHKTQGSEFEHVAIVLPKQAEHQLLSRELLYTGITRAKEKLTIASNQKTWQFSVGTAIKRHSGLIL